MSDNTISDFSAPDPTFIDLNTPSAPPAAPPVSEMSSFSTQDTLSSGASSNGLAVTEQTESGLVLLAPPDITIKAFSKIINDTLNVLKSQLDKQEFLDQLLYSNLIRSNVITAAYLSAFKSYLRGSGSSYEAFVANQNSQISTMNNAITAYRNAVISSRPAPNSDVQQTQAMNNAIAAYNNSIPPDDAAFNTAADTYNNYVNGRNADLAAALATYNDAVNTYNSQVDANNAQLIQINAERAIYGLPPIALQQHINPAAPFPNQANAPLAKPVPTIPIPSLPNTITPIDPPPSTDELIKTYYKPVKAEFKSYSDRINDVIANNIKNKDFQYFFLQGQISPAANAYIYKAPKLSMSSTPGAAASGGGVSLATLVLGLNSEARSGIVSKMLWASDVNFSSQPLSPYLFAQSSAIALSLMANASLFAGASAIFTLLKFPEAGTESAVAALALALGFNQGVLKLIESNQASIEFAKLLTQLTPDAPAENVQKTANLLASLFHFQLLQIATFNTAKTLGTPGLAPQLLGNAVGTQAVQQAIQNQQRNSALNNPLALQNAISESANALNPRLPDQRQSNQRLPDQRLQEQLDALAIANEAFGRLLNSQFRSQGDVRSGLVSYYRERGIADGNAAAASARANAFLSEELGASYLNSVLDEKRLDASYVASRIVNDASLRSILLNRERLQNDIEANLQKSSLQTYRDLRNIIAESLEQQNVRVEDALPLSNNAVLAIGAQNPQQIREPGLQVQLAPTEIADQIAAIIQQNLKVSIGHEAAARLAAEFNESVVGTSSRLSVEETKVRSSIYEAIQRQRQNISEANSEIADLVVLDALQNFLNPNDPLLQLIKDNNTLAYAYLDTIWTGLMYGREMPTNYKKSVDIPI